LHKFPHEFLELPRKEKALVIAMIQKRVENEKKKEAELKSKIK